MNVHEKNEFNFLYLTYSKPYELLFVYLYIWFFSPGYFFDQKTIQEFYKKKIDWAKVVCITFAKIATFKVPFWAFACFSKFSTKKIETSKDCNCPAKVE